MTDPKPHIRWDFEWLHPSEYTSMKDWAVGFKQAGGVTVIRFLGFNVRVFK